MKKHHSRFFGPVSGHQINGIVFIGPDQIFNLIESSILCYFVNRQHRQIISYYLFYAGALQRVAAGAQTRCRQCFLGFRKIIRKY